MLRLPRLPLNEPSYTLLARYWQRLVEGIESAVNANSEAIELIQAAQAAIADANTAIENANTAIATAESAIETVSAESALVNSYIVPDGVLSATPTNITIATHQRWYADGTVVTVQGATLPHAAAAGITMYVSYTDPSRAGGTVGYSSADVAPAQINNVHVVGAVTIPSSGSQAGGSGPRRPGEVEP